MGVFIFCLIVLLLVLCVFMVFSFEFDSTMSGVILGLIVLVCGVFLPYISHNSSLATIDNSERIIQIQSEYKESLIEQLNSLPKTDAALMNSDSPVSSIVEEIASAEGKIAQAKQDVLDAEISIQKRKRGLTSYILWFF